MICDFTSDLKIKIPLVYHHNSIPKKQIMEKKDFKILKAEIPYAGFFRLERYQLQHTLFKGGWSNTLTRELFERGTAAAVLLYDPNQDKIVLLEQFRIGAIQSDNPWLFETVAGIIEQDELPDEVVKRETMEEAGTTISELEFIAEFFVSPGGTSEKIYLYCAKVDVNNVGRIQGVADEGEDIAVHVVAFTEAIKLLNEGKINSATPIIALQWLILNRERLREKWA